MSASPVLPHGSRVLVTGGAGFIGGHLMESLLALGAQVRVLDDLSTGREEILSRFVDRIEFHRGSITDADTCGRAVAGMDYILHHAAIPSVPRSVADPEESHLVNAGGTLQLLEAARTSKALRRLVYAGTCAVYADGGMNPSSEDDAPAPSSPYGATKLAGELYCRAWHRSYGVPTVVLRYFNVFGPRQDPNSTYAAVVPKFIARMRNGERPVIFGDGTQTRDFVSVRDIVRANLLACLSERAPGGVFNIGSGRRTSLLQLVAELNALLGTNLEPEFAPARTGDILHSVAAVDAAREMLGFTAESQLRERLWECVGS